MGRRQGRVVRQVNTRASNQGDPELREDFTTTDKDPTTTCLKCESASRLFPPGEGPSRVLIRDCEIFG